MSDSSRLALSAIAGAIIGAGVLLAARRTNARWPRAGRAGTALAVAIVATPLLIGAWIGANSHTMGWFGSQVGHGPRDRREVALTFDDGPNDSATLAIASILEARGTTGTFFVVGRAVQARPETARRLVERGHLLGNHSFRHDAKGWLDPRYPELMRTQRAIKAATGTCPAFYRAPHGQHTPLLARVVHAHGLIMIGWDASAGDWATKSPGVVARRILRKVRPGSIIDLHDGLDGNPKADRSVLVRALPLILDGLEQRHLVPVRLDALLDRRGTLATC